MHTLVLPIVIVWLLYLCMMTIVSCLISAINLTGASIIALGLISQVAGLFWGTVVVKITLQCRVYCKMCLTRGFRLILSTPIVLILVLTDCYWLMKFMPLQLF